jgi:Putative peptidoglycan binding domain/Trypsin-like peptidase domain
MAWGVRVGRWLVIVLAMACVAGAAMAQGTNRAFVQIEAQPTLAEAQKRARAYAAAFPDVVGFRMASGWYAIALGPYAPNDAATRLATLRSGNLIPGDSFVAGGEVYRTPFWPVGVNPAEAPLVQPDGTPQSAEVSPAEPAPAEIAPAAAPPLPDETPAEARRSEGLLETADRQAIQSALQWFGFYDAAIDGAFGPGTRAAMAGWQTARGLEPTGILTTAQRAALLDERAQIEAELGLQPLTEPEAGIALSLPAALVEFDRYDPPFVHFRAKGDSGIRLSLISQPGDEATLPGLYEVLQTLDSVPLSGPRELRDRSFVIEGADARLATYATAELSGGLVKGYMLTWEPRAADLAGRVLKSINASFRPVGTRALDPGLVPLDDGMRAGMLAGMEVRRPAFSRTGFYVSGDGAVLTTTEVADTCSRLTLDGEAEADVTLRDDTLGIAVLTPRVALAPSKVATLDPAEVRPGSEIVVSGYSYEDALPAPALTYGTLDGATGLEGEADLRRLTLPALPGDAGGPVLDATGAVLGMLLPRATGGARVLPDEVSFAVSARTLAARLTAAGLTLAPVQREGALAPQDLADRATAMTVLVSCWK